MDSDLLSLIDSDAHVTEPRDVWTSRVSSKWGDLVPHVKLVERADTKEVVAAALRQGKSGAFEAWFIGDQMITPACSSAMAGWPEPFPSHPPTYAQAHPAAYDANARLKVMNDSGIYAQVLYPNVGGFGSQRFRNLADQELALACVRAYNDFLIDWVEPARRRFVPVAAIPYWNARAAAEEVRRAAAIGHKGIIFPGAPHVWGVPYMADRHWDPLWKAAEECGMPISFHAGSGNLTANFEAERLAIEGLNAAYARSTTAIFFDAASTLADLLCSGILPRFPDLKFVIVESGVGWIPFLLESIDYHFEVGNAYQQRREFKEKPSFYYHRQVFASYWFERSAPDRLLDLVGVDNVMFETDFPHPTSLYGDDVQRSIKAGLGGQPDAVVRKILFENAAKLYGIEMPDELPPLERTPSLRGRGVLSGGSPYAPSTSA